MLRAWTEQGNDRHALIIRPTVTFGPRNFANMYTLIHQIQRGRFLLVGKGENIKSLSYVENIVDATLYLLGKDRETFDVFNYIDKPDFTSMKITKTVYAALGKKIPSFVFPMWLALLMAIPFDVVIAVTGKNLPVSSARLKKLFSMQTKFEADRLAEAGYTPMLPLEEGIRRMVKWYQDEGHNEQAVWHIPPAEPVLR